MTTFVFPDTKTIQLIEQEKLPNLMAQREIFKIFNTTTSDDTLLEWEQLDNYTGLQALRGIDGQPARVKRVGAKSYIAQPGVFGEYTTLNERDMLRRRAFGTINQRVDISDLILQEHEILLGRELDRQELIGWNLLLNGTFSISAPHGGVTFTDSYTTQTFDAIVPWATHLTATPLDDFRQVKLKARGHSVRFDQSATAYMNSQTAIHMMSNTNPDDLYGRRTTGLGTFNSLGEIQALMTMDGLPQIVEYDQGYLDDNGAFQLWIPDGYVVLVGNRISGAQVAQYRFTRNVNNPDMAPGPYTRVIDNGERAIPREIQVHRGHNGGPVMFFPSAIVVMEVADVN